LLAWLIRSASSCVPYHLPSPSLNRALVECLTTFSFAVLDPIINFNSCLNYCHNFAICRHFKLSKEETARGESKEQLEAAIISRVGIQGHEKDN